MGSLNQSEGRRTRSCLVMGIRIASATSELGFWRVTRSSVSHALQGAEAMGWQNRIDRRLNVESLESRAMLAGDVLATVEGGNLLITGDGADNDIRIVQTADDTFQIIGDGTSVND